VEHVRNDARVDDVDLRILECWSRDARLSVRAVGREIGMSAGAVSERVSRLEEAGVIRGYHADVDPAALGYQMQVMIGLKTEQGPDVTETINQLLAVPEIVAVHVVTGTWDLVLVAQVRDHHHLRDVVLQGVWQIVGFRHSETMLILDSHASSVWT
jgi:DNA-binding Lrp family transcriptional regulator